MDLNADIGEEAGHDGELLQLVTSASIACGAHAGGVAVMRETVQLALQRGVAIGAHPGYPDRANFGRVETGASPSDIERMIIEQVETLRVVCAGAGAHLRYVKPHGALYNRGVHDAEAAAAIASAVRTVDVTLVLLGPPDSAMLRAASGAGLRAAREAFLDRAYNSDGTLVPRDVPGAVLSDVDAAADRALALARGDPITDISGAPLRVSAESLCVHGDSPAAPAIARAVRARLGEAGIALAPFA